MIVIQGAGISGLTLAALLERLDLDYLLVESAPELHPIGAGIVLQRNALAVLNLLTAADWRQHSAAIDAMVLGTPTDPELQVIELDSRTSAAGFHRGALQAFLLAQIPAQRLLLNCTVSDWHETSTDSMNVRLSNGEALTARHLIGADGIASAIRRQLTGATPSRDCGQWCARTIIPGHPFGQSAMEIQGGRHRLGVVPLGQQQSYVFWVRSRHDGSALASNTIAEYLGEMGEVGGRVSKLLSPTQQWLQHPLLDVPIYWGRHHIMLIGDAAHAVTPNMGQGAALGIEDAYLVAGMLARDYQSTSAELLKQLRHSRIRNVRTLSYLMGRLAHTESRWLQRLRQELLSRSQPEHSRRVVAGWLERFTRLMPQFDGTPLCQSAE